MQNLAQMESLIAQRERALFDVLVDDLAHWVSETVPSSAAAVAAAESRCRASSAAAATGTDDTAAAATPSIASAAASFGDRRSDFFDSIRDGRVLCALLAAISSQNAPTQTPMRGRSGSSAAASDFQARDNLTIFLKGCKALEVPEVSLFEPDDLVQRKNLKRVVSALLQLARVAARRFGVPPPASILAELEIEAVEAAESAAAAANAREPTAAPIKAAHLFVDLSDDFDADSNSDAPDARLHLSPTGWRMRVSSIPLSAEENIVYTEHVPRHSQSELHSHQQHQQHSDAALHSASLVASPPLLVARIVRAPSLDAASASASVCTPRAPNRQLPSSPLLVQPQHEPNESQPPIDSLKTDQVVTPPPARISVAAASSHSQEEISAVPTQHVSTQPVFATPRPVPPRQGTAIPSSATPSSSSTQQQQQQQRPASASVSRIPHHSSNASLLPPVSTPASRPRTASAAATPGAQAVAAVYRASPNDPIDVQVGMLLAQLDASAPTIAADSAAPSATVASAASAKKAPLAPSTFSTPALLVQCTAPGCYLINGERKVYVRLIRNVVMARVGGGWEDFFCFLARYRHDHPRSCSASSSHHSTPSASSSSSLQQQQQHQHQHSAASAIPSTFEVRDLDSFVSFRLGNTAVAGLRK